MARGRMGLMVSESSTPQGLSKYLQTISPNKFQIKGSFRQIKDSSFFKETIQFFRIQKPTLKVEMDKSDLPFWS